LWQLFEDVVEEVHTVSSNAVHGVATLPPHCEHRLHRAAELGEPWVTTYAWRNPPLPSGYAVEHTVDAEWLDAEGGVVTGVGTAVGEEVADGGVVVD
jgi:hypothetical protein